jgi:Arc/MetJ family transcription regulator
MTMHIDEVLLERVMREYQFPSKTEAVEAALKELDRQMRIREFRTHGLGLTPE